MLLLIWILLILILILILIGHRPNVNVVVCDDAVRVMRLDIMNERE